jgi:multiple sugar transport system permease protein
LITSAPRTTSAPRAERGALLGMSRRQWRSQRNGLLFISPWIIGFAVLALYPIAISLYYSFTNFQGIGTAQWVGLANYQKLLSDSTYRIAVVNTLYFTVIFVPASTALSLGMALLLNQKRRGIAVYRTAVFIPSIVPLVASAAVWLWLLNPEYGLFNTVLNAVGLPSNAWLLSPTWVKPSLILISLWQVGGSMVIYLAGLQQVPLTLYEAASLDGAGRLRKFWHITVPMLSPVILFNVIIALVGSIQYFTQAMVLTGPLGDPLESSLMYVTYLYRNAFALFSMGYAAAMAWVLFLITMLCTLVLLAFSARRVYYAGK